MFAHRAKHMLPLYKSRQQWIFVLKLMWEECCCSPATESSNLPAQNRLLQLIMIPIYLRQPKAISAIVWSIHCGKFLLLADWGTNNSSTANYATKNNRKRICKIGRLSLRKLLLRVADFADYYVSKNGQPYLAQPNIPEKIRGDMSRFTIDCVETFVVFAKNRSDSMKNAGVHKAFK